MFQLMLGRLDKWQMYKYNNKLITIDYHLNI